jgi:hypothetical protein
VLLLKKYHENIYLAPVFLQPTGCCRYQPAPSSRANVFQPLVEKSSEFGLYSQTKKNIPERKHQVILNLMGSTPIFGLEYSYRAWESKRKRITLETGLGIGANAFSAEDYKRYRDKGIFPFNISHHVRVLFFRNGFIYPYVGYYGILISGGNFSNNDSPYYRPNFGAGFRIGDPDIFAMQLGATAYLNCCTSGRDPIELNRYYSSVLPSFSLHVPLGGK